MRPNVQRLDISSQTSNATSAVSPIDVSGLASPTAQRTSSLTIRGLRTSSDDPAHMMLVKTILNPVVVVLTLLGCILFHGELLSAYYMVLAVLAFFISSQTLDDVDLYRSWRKPLTWTDGRQIFLNW